ncbi:AAA family ATPase (plasmid) [Devosia sp. A8/3-2]|nr:AAA family ATPase [Devosia sp. A8/3-2]
MKRLIVINGVMGVGKSTTARALCDLLQPSFFLDGDWCWSMSPFNPTEADKRMVLDNIAHLLRSFLLSDRPYVVFCWVLHEDAIWSSIATELEGVEFETYRFTLTATPETLSKRLARDVAAGIRDARAIDRSIARLPQFSRLSTRKLDVSQIGSGEAARQIAAAISEP